MVPGPPCPFSFSVVVMGRCDRQGPITNSSSENETYTIYNYTIIQLTIIQFYSNGQNLLFYSFILRMRGIAGTGTLE